MGALNRSYTTPTSSRLLPSPFTRTLNCPLPSNIFNFPIPTISLALSSSSSFSLCHAHPTKGKATGNRTRIRHLVSATAIGSLEEVLPPALDSTSDPPAIFDGTTRLYISFRCPYAQRVWITRNCKGLQDKIKLVPINLQNRPAWYKEKVNPANKDPVKIEFAGEIFSYTNSFNKAVASSFKEEEVNDETSAAFDYLETALGKFDDGPFLLGQFSLVDIAYAPFIERYKPFLLDVKNYDIVAGRPRLAKWIEQMDNIEAYERTQRDPKEHVEAFKQRFMAKT